MPAAALRDRLAGIVASAQQEAALDAMRVIAGDLIEEGGIGNLADPAVQAELDKYLDGVDLLILDNLSSLTAVIRDNDQESWTTIQQWLLRLRRRAHLGLTCPPCRQGRRTAWDESARGRSRHLDQPASAERLCRLRRREVRGSRREGPGPYRRRGQAVRGQADGRSWRETDLDHPRNCRRSKGSGRGPGS